MHPHAISTISQGAPPSKLPCLYIHIIYKKIMQNLRFWFMIVSNLIRHGTIYPLVYTHFLRWIILIKLPILIKFDLEITNSSPYSKSNILSNFKKNLDRFIQWIFYHVNYALNN